jgi:hypothetical protein
MPMYEVIRYYTVADVYHVPADSEDQAYEIACSGEYHSKSYDSPEDNGYEVTLLEEQTA